MYISPSIQTFILILLSFLTLYALLKHYALHLNKRKKNIVGIPEPLGAWPILGHLHLLWGRVPIFRVLGAMTNNYGPIYTIRLGKFPVIVISNWELVKECFTTNDKVFATRPIIAAGKYIGYDNAAFAFSPYGQYWRDVRKMATVEILSNERLALLNNVRKSEVDWFIKDLFPLCSNNNVVPLSELIEDLTFNICLRLVVGKRFSTKCYSEEYSDAGRFKRAIKEAMHLSGDFVLLDAVPFLEWLNFHGGVKAMKRTFNEYDLVLQNWLEEHQRLRREVIGGLIDIERDLMHVMLSILEKQDEVFNYSRDTVIKATALMIISAGTESTSVTLIWAISLLLNNPSVLKKSQEELDIHLRRDKWVQESDIENLPYLKAIVKETLRMYPPGPIGGPREAMEDCHIGGYYVPKGTGLTVNIWKLHRDPRIWLNPDEFKPERFMTTHKNVGLRGQNFEYIPFGSGRRSCPGINFGLLIVHLVLARLIQGFDLWTKDGKLVDMGEGFGIALPKLRPLEVVLSPRLHVDLYKCI